MFLELVISKNVRISYSDKFKTFYPLFTLVTAISMGLLFIYFSIFDKNAPNEFLYFGVGFTFIGAIGFLSYAKKSKKMDTLTIFSANSSGVKYSHRPFEPEKTKEVSWSGISKIILTEKFVSKRDFLFRGSRYKRSLIIYFANDYICEMNFLNQDEYQTFSSPKKHKYTVIKYPKNIKNELLQALLNISPKDFPVLSIEKTIFDHRNETEEYVS